MAHWQVIFWRPPLPILSELNLSFLLVWQKSLHTTISHLICFAISRGQHQTMRHRKTWSSYHSCLMKFLSLISRGTLNKRAASEPLMNEKKRRPQWILEILDNCEKCRWFQKAPFQKKNCYSWNNQKKAGLGSRRYNLQSLRKATAITSAWREQHPA